MAGVGISEAHFCRLACDATILFMGHIVFSFIVSIWHCIQLLGQLILMEYAALVTAPLRNQPLLHLISKKLGSFSAKCSSLNIRIMLRLSLLMVVRSRLLSSISIWHLIVASNRWTYEYNFAMVWLLCIPEPQASLSVRCCPSPLMEYVSPLINKEMWVLTPAPIEFRQNQINILLPFTARWRPILGSCIQPAIWSYVVMQWIWMYAHKSFALIVLQREHI